MGNISATVRLTQCNNSSAYTHIHTHYSTKKYTFQPTQLQSQCFLLSISFYSDHPAIYTYSLTHTNYCWLLSDVCEVSGLNIFSLSVGLQGSAWSAHNSSRLSTDGEYLQDCLNKVHMQALGVGLHCHTQRCYTEL